MLIRFLPLLTALLLAACSTEGPFKLPFVYRVNIQQGNVIDQAMLDRLQPGMNKNQVRYIMGTPVLHDPFHANRWDYIYTFSKGGARRKQRHVVLYFKNDKLASVAGDVVTANRKTSDMLNQTPSTTVEVPPGYNQKGFFQRLWDDLPFVGDDNPHPPEQGGESGESPSDPDEAGE